VIDNRNYTDVFTPQETENTIKTTGIAERRFVSDGVCSSDLCYDAAEILIKDMNIDRNSIDMLIFLSQTPDYHQPATAPILQNRLGLKKSCAAFDINLACSGYVYGLSTAFSYASQQGIDNVLFLVGETLSKITSKDDKATSLLFGDGGTATLIGKSNNEEISYFSLNSDGSGFNVLIIPGGGYRNKSSADTLKIKKYEDNSQRHEEHLLMDGIEVFNFTMREVPKDIKRILQYSESELDDINYIVFHQANKFMTDFFAKKLRYPIEKVPYSLQKYGNTSAVSIPLTIVSEMKHLLTEPTNIIISGYGGGLSWGTALLNMKNIHVSDLKEV
jgi:3-oxoacyl-[acyl-carrier-protein] synthase-3